ncbi:hypothetical protein ACHAXH_008788 [Discostella pseudostelligera]
MGDSAYSFSLTTFSRTGKLLQIEYALNAVANGRTALGIAAVDGVVIATDKKFGSPLVEGSGVRKVEKITEGSGFVYAGVGPDYRVLGKFELVSFISPYGYVNANNFLEKRYQDDMELEDAIHTALLTLREGFEGEMNGHNIEVGVVSKADGKFRLLTPEQIQDYLDEAN